jgi:ubiquinone/menaquinone biosynthesis C-methylase UbiE
MPAPYDSYDYLSYWEDRSFEDCCERLALERFLKKIGRQETIIDIGGGFGRLLSLYAPLFKKCWVTDPSERLLAMGRELNKGIKNVTFRKASLPRLPFAKNSFDTVLTIRVSHHLRELRPAFIETGRLLKPEGFFILEVANKIHFLARVKALLTGDFSFVQNLEPIEKRSQENIRSRAIIFSNHHPKKVIQELEETGFVVKEILSVSNFRRPFLKKILPHAWLLSGEKFCQKPFGQFFFGPSIFILAQKRGLVVLL